MMCRWIFTLLVIPGLVIAVAGCGAKKTDAQQLPTPMVTAQPPVQREVIQYESFTGRTEPTDSVEIRAKVSGYLTKIHFQPGVELEKDALLFDIDPAPYKADLTKAEADELAAKARLAQLTTEVARLDRGRVTGAVTADEFEKAAGNKAEADANLKAAKSKVETAKLNLGYTQIKAPLTGRIGDKLVSEGNLVAGGQGTTTLLTTILAIDPMDVSFDIDENTLQRLQAAIREGKIKLNKPGEIPAEMGLAIHGNKYPLKGFVQFINNTIDPKTGTIQLKAQFLNPKSDTGVRMLTPGMFARVRLPLGAPAQKWVVPEAAIGSDQGTKYLFAVGPENKAVRLDAVLGVPEEGMRVIESVRGPGDKEPRSLTAADSIIVNGLQRVRPGLAVDPQPARKN